MSDGLSNFLGNKRIFIIINNIIEYYWIILKCLLTVNSGRSILIRQERTNDKNGGMKMARAFTSLPAEGRYLRTEPRGQMKIPPAPIKISDYSVKDACAASSNANSRKRFESCEGLVGIITPKTPDADAGPRELNGPTVEAACLLLNRVHAGSENRLMKSPIEIHGITVQTWSQNDIKELIGFLAGGAKP